MGKTWRLSWINGFIGTCLVILLISWGCGGGGGVSSSSGSSGSTGSVGVLLTDGPADEYDHIWVIVTEVSLLPTEDCKDGEEVVIFTSPGGYRFDLLQYRDDDFLLTLKENIPVGNYAKIRLKVSDVEAYGGPCDDMEIKVPSGKIDLKPRSGSIVVTADTTLYIRLDIDANKSINLHEAGNSGKCIFRPVVFVDVLAREDISSCPTLVKGIVKEVWDVDQNGVPEAFTIAREYNCMGNILVNVNEETIVIKADGTSDDISSIEVGQPVTVRGIMSHGCIEASLVVIGNALVLKGTVNDPISSTGFSFTTGPLEPITGTFDVVLSADTLIKGFCGSTASLEDIIAGSKVIVLGKYNADEDRLYAAMVIVQPTCVEGTVTGIAAVDGGYDISVDTGGVTPEVVRVTGNYEFRIEGDGLVSNELIPLLNFIGRHVKIVQGATLTLVTVTPKEVYGTVTAIDTVNRTITLDGVTKIRVTLLATGIDLSGEHQCPIAFSGIEVGDTIRCFGVDAVAESLVDFYAYIYIVSGSTKDNDDGDDKDDDDDDGDGQKNKIKKIKK